MSTYQGLKGRTFSILGDSYSTFDGYIPAGNACYYPNPECVDNVLRVEETWWHRLAARNDMRLLFNESYSGATVCTQVREEQPPESSFVVRAHYLADHPDEKGDGPDIIFCFGATNDSWLERKVGAVQFQWADEDLQSVLPACCAVLDTLRKEHPQATLVWLINTELNPAIAAGIVQAAPHWGAVALQLREIDKQCGHPSALGMLQITEQIEANF